jgi:hypothetical protein
VAASFSVIVRPSTHAAENPAESRAARAEPTIRWWSFLSLPGSGESVTWRSASACALPGGSSLPRNALPDPLRGTLTLAAIEARASRILNVPVRVLVLPYAQLGADIDRPEDLEMARRLKNKD